MPVRLATTNDLPAWIALRQALWPDTTQAEHLLEAKAELAKPQSAATVYLYCNERGAVRAFAEATLRHDHVNGCNTSPVAFLEGIYVHPEDQGGGIGRQLVQAIQHWAEALGCTELASDADLDTRDSRAFHASLGFAETQRVIFFRKPLKP